MTENRTKFITPENLNPNGQEDQVIETGLNQTTNNNTIEEYIYAFEQKNENDTILMAKYSVKMRHKILNMELTVLKTFYDNNLIKNDNETLQKIRNMEKSKGVNMDLDINDFKEAENVLLEAENLSNELMRKIKAALKKNTTQKEVKKPAPNIEVPDYRSIVTVRGTEEDVINCILKADAAFNNKQYDKAERLLVKAERIFSTENARNLLKEVRDSKHSLNSESIEQSTESLKNACTVMIGIEDTPDANALSLSNEPKETGELQSNIKLDKKNSNMMQEILLCCIVLIGIMLIFFLFYVFM